MIMRNKEDLYAKFQKLGSGILIKYFGDQDIEAAILEQSIDIRCTEDYASQQGWTPIEPTLETLTGGEVLLRRDGVEYKVLARLGGLGKFSSYLLSTPIFDIAGGMVTADELARKEFKIILPSTPEPKKKMTLAEVEKLVGEPVEIVE